MLQVQQRAARADTAIEQRVEVEDKAHLDAALLVGAAVGIRQGVPPVLVHILGDGIEPIAQPLDAGKRDADRVGAPDLVVALVARRQRDLIARNLPNGLCSQRSEAAVTALLSSARNVSFVHAEGALQYHCRTCKIVLQAHVHAVNQDRG